MRPTGVVIDTSVWIEFLRGTDAGRSAAVALAGDFAVFSIDNRFRLIPGLRLHRPTASGA